MKWPLVTLGEVAEVVGGSTPSRDREEYWNGHIPWLTPTDLPMPGEGIGEVTATGERITDAGLSAISASLLPPDTVLFSSRATIGKIGIAAVPLVTNQGFANLVPSKAILSKFLAYCLLYYREEISRLAGSTTFKEVRRSALRRFQIPLPPLSEQRRIVEILDHADALRKKRAEADAKAARILPALFYKMFGDPATNPKGLEQARLGDVIKVRSGVFLPSRNMDSGGQYPVFGGNGINGHHSQSLLDGPVIIIGRVGVYCGSVHYCESACWVTDNALYVAEHDERLHPRYLAEALRLANLNEYAGRAGQPLISGSRIYPVKIMIPEWEQQVLFARLIKETKRLGQKLEVLDHAHGQLFATILHRAFTGDLTARWREAHMTELLAEMEAQAKILEAVR